MQSLLAEAQPARAAKLTWLVKVATTIGVAFGTTSFDFSLKKQSVGTNPERQMHVYGACQAISIKHKQQRHIMRSRSASAAAASAMRQGGLLHTEEQAHQPHQDSLQFFLANTM